MFRPPYTHSDKMNMPKLLLSAILALFLALSPMALAAEETNLLSNGDFETAKAGAETPKDWPMPQGVSWLEEDGNHFLRLEAVPDKMITVYRELPLKGAPKAMKLTFRARVNDLQRGKANWHDGRVILELRDADDKKMSPATGAPGTRSFKGTSKGWEQNEVEFIVPEDAVKLVVMPSMFSAASGSYDLDDMVLVAVDPQPILEAQAVAAAKKAQDVATRAAKVKPQVPVTPADKLPPMLHVEGNLIKDANGKEVWLQGVAIPSMGWAAGGERILESTEKAIDDWKANVLRLAVKENFWNGVGPYQQDGGAGYRQLVDDVVNLASSKGAYVVIDLHRFRAPEPAHAAFWTDVATKYKNHPAVIFELFNEPHDISWEVWRDGGFVSTEKKKDTDALTENKEKLKGFESIGMQALVDAVRNTGAKNIVIVGGLDWSYTLEGVLNGFALNDRDGNGIVYSTHVYSWKSGWKKAFMDAAEKYPIFIGECGAPQQRMEFIPESMHEDPSTWVPDFLGLVQKHKYHWTAWSFHPKASPVLLKDWTFEPNDYWGLPAKEALAGKKFELKKTR